MAHAAELSEAARARVAERRALVLEHLPELVPVVRELHELGLIDGWRAVRRVELVRRAGPLRPPAAAGWRRITRWSGSPAPLRLPGNHLMRGKR